MIVPEEDIDKQLTCSEEEPYWPEYMLEQQIEGAVLTAHVSHEAIVSKFQPWGQGGGR